MLPFALHGYRTSVRTSTGATPFSLVYGMEDVLPVEVEIPSMRVLMEAKLTEAEWVQGRYDQLNLIEEKRLTAMCHGQLYQQRMKKAFDKKVKPRVFREGDLVLKKVFSFAPDSRGKWTPNYEGPYVVKRAFSSGALILTTMDGEDFTRLVNSDAVCRLSKILAQSSSTEVSNTLNSELVKKWSLCSMLSPLASAEKGDMSPKSPGGLEFWPSSLGRCVYLQPQIPREFESSIGVLSIIWLSSLVCTGLKSLIN
ncbi:hypothetical protein KIW84_072229 [Lathyrus oleraceus]|uniref:Uncharacterized protein n=1 Tax=Pisum sativum TaxID=3888 RepID=A0A9D4VLK2_PEA|nr:hypothetical protein KIW84_072229 [Pisum sativum]